MKEPRRIPAHAIDRPALRARLDAGLDSPLSVVVAPAGAGKTVLLAQWALSRAGQSTAWVDVGAGDAGAAALAERIARAVADVDPSFRAPMALVSGTRDAWGEPYLEDLTAALADVSPIVVVFDDLDRLTGSPLLTDLWRMVDLLPSTVHFVFASRVDLQLGWSRQRVQHGLVELRQEQLAFDERTTSLVIQAITGRPVSVETAQTVASRTEGWAAGVQLTALSLRFAADPSRVVGALKDTDRLVVDYLSEEVLDALDEPRRMALKQLAVLDQFSAPLVEAVLDVPGMSFIDELERDSLFVVPVPGEPGWYRYHRLFRDLLLLRLRAHAPDVEATVLRRAAVWCSAADREDEAIEYLLRAQDFEQALDRLISLGREVYEQRRTLAVAHWLAEIPEHLRLRRPEAEILLAMTNGMSGRGTDAVDALRALIAEGELSVGQRQVALTYLAACVQLHPHAEIFLDVGRRAVAALNDAPEADRPSLLGLTSGSMLRVVAQVSLGRAHLFRGELAAARGAITTALQLDGMAYRLYRVHALGSLALVEALAGRLTESAALSNEALAIAHEFGLLDHPGPADAFLARAFVAIQRGEPDIGALALAEGTVRASSNQRTQLLWLARLASMIIDREEAELLSEPDGPPPEIVRVTATALAVRRARLLGSSSPPPTSPPPGGTWSALAFEDVATQLTLGRPEAARACLARIRFDLDPLATTTLVEHDLLLGWLHALEGRRALSREHLSEALGRAELEWLVHPFVRAGPVVADLVDEIPGQGDAFRRVVVSKARAEAAPGRHAVADDLTPRERELLAYLPSRLTIAEIAGRCFVSTNTVKTHLGHIYRKLGVAGRDAAISSAIERGMLAEFQVVHPVG